MFFKEGTKLDVFDEAHALVLEIYKITKSFPKEEQYRLVDQIIRAAYSIPSNIVEGYDRNTTKEYLNFLYIARGSSNELKYFLMLSKDLKYITNDTYEFLLNKCNSIGKMLNGLINYLKRKLATSSQQQATRTQELS